MAKGVFPVRCAYCKKISKADITKQRWCECGGLWVKIYYGQRKRKTTRSGR